MVAPGTEPYYAYQAHRARKNYRRMDQQAAMLALTAGLFQGLGYRRAQAREQEQNQLLVDKLGIEQDPGMTPETAIKAHTIRSQSQMDEFDRAMKVFGYEKAAFALEQERRAAEQSRLRPELEGKFTQLLGNQRIDAPGAHEMVRKGAMELMRRSPESKAFAQSGVEQWETAYGVSPKQVEERTRQLADMEKEYRATTGSITDDIKKLEGRRVGVTELMAMQMLSEDERGAFAQQMGQGADVTPEIRSLLDRRYAEQREIGLRAANMRADPYKRGRLPEGIRQAAQRLYQSNSVEDLDGLAAAAAGTAHAEILLQMLSPNLSPSAFAEMILRSDERYAGS